MDRPAPLPQRPTGPFGKSQTPQNGVCTSHGEPGATSSCGTSHRRDKARRRNRWVAAECRERVSQTCSLGLRLFVDLGRTSEEPQT